MANQIETAVVKPSLKFTEGENEYLILTNEYESKLDGGIATLINFMKQNDGKGKSSFEKDQLYADGQKYWREYSLTLKDTKYNLHLNRQQYNFLTTLLLSKLEYDVNTVFFAIELKEMLAGMHNIKYVNDKDLVAFPVNATEITYVYHLISKHTVKGLCKDAFTFSEILIRIGNISKIFNYYDNEGKTLATYVKDWVACFEDGVTSDKMIDVQTSEAVEEPKQKKSKKEKTSAE